MAILAQRPRPLRGASDVAVLKLVIHCRLTEALAEMLKNNCSLRGLDLTGYEAWAWCSRF